jgi:tryptophan halogenase
MSAFKIVIVGGGTAGWLSAAFLYSQLPLTLRRPVDISVVEAQDIPTIGVGEATLPSLKQTLAACRIDEAEFLRECDATFKHGIEFSQWRKSPQDAPNESFFHPFSVPIMVGDHNPVHQWVQLPIESRGDFATVFSIQSEIVKAGIAPKSLKDKQYDGALSYAYHLDAGKFAEFLKKRFCKKGVKNIISKVVDVQGKDEDNIESIKLENGQSLTADLFIDCTGFAAYLLNFDKKNYFVDKSNNLFVDRAVTTRVTHEGINDIKGFTKCTAQKSGWIWDIALHERRGVGHVYSSRHMNDDEASEILANYLNIDLDDLDIRKLKMKIGYHKKQWRGNCVGIGLSSGFLEPLESTGIYLIEMANWALVELLPRYASNLDVEGQYNNIMVNHYENITDFIKLHYCLSQRDDSEFWRDNRELSSIPASLQEKLEQWKTTVPSVYDFQNTVQCFSVNNYLFMLYGMNWGQEICTVPSQQKDYIQAYLRELSIRRERLKEYVLRDTDKNSEIYKALGL